MLKSEWNKGELCLDEFNELTEENSLLFCLEVV